MRVTPLLVRAAEAVLRAAPEAALTPLAESETITVASQASPHKSRACMRQEGSCLGSLGCRDCTTTCEASVPVL